MYNYTNKESEDYHMPTDKPRITFTVDEDLFDKITDYKYSHRMKNQSQAILSLIEKGMNALHQDIIATKDFNSFSILELDLIKKYRALDKHGKEIIDFLLEKEYERSSLDRKQPDEFGFTSEEDLIVIPNQYKKAE